MNGFGTSLAEYFTKKIAIIVATFGIVALCSVLGFWLYTNNEQKKIIDINQDVDSVIVNGDTTKKLYVLEDTLTGMVWIGIPGVNRLKK